MSASHTAAAETPRIANFARAVRRLFAVVFGSVSAAAERVVAHAGEPSSAYYRFPWF